MRARRCVDSYMLKLDSTGTNKRRSFTLLYRYVQIVINVNLVCHSRDNLRVVTSLSGRGVRRRSSPLMRAAQRQPSRSTREGEYVNEYGDWATAAPSARPTDGGLVVVCRRVTRSFGFGCKPTTVFALALLISLTALVASTTWVQRSAVEVERLRDLQLSAPDAPDVNLAAQVVAPPKVSLFEHERRTLMTTIVREGKIKPQIAIVVTWCCGNSVDHLARRFAKLPADLLGLVFVAKTPESKCDALSAEVLKMTWVCAGMPNAQGREVPSMAWFMHEYYDDLPELIVFSHDDRNLEGGMATLIADLENASDIHAQTQIVQERVEAMRRANEVDASMPVQTSLTTTSHISPSIVHEKLSPTYGYLNKFGPFLRGFMDIDASVMERAALFNATAQMVRFDDYKLFLRVLGEDIYWPVSANFGISKEMVHLRSRRFYAAIYQIGMCDGKFVSAIGSSTFAALEWAHAFERAWLPIVFNAFLKERPAEAFSVCFDDAHFYDRCFETFDRKTGAHRLIPFRQDMHGQFKLKGQGFIEGENVATLERCGGDTWHDKPLPNESSNV